MPTSERLRSPHALRLRAGAITASLALAATVAPAAGAGAATDLQAAQSGHGSPVTTSPAAVAAGGMTAAPATATRRRSTTQVADASWNSAVQLRRGTRRGLKVAKGALWFKGPSRQSVRGRTWESGTWTSPWTTPGFGVTSLIPSWEAQTPGDSMVRVQVRARDAAGRSGTWDTVADWALDNPAVARTTLSGQSDDNGRVSVDTWLAASAVSSWQVRVTLLRAPGSKAAVAVERIGASASAVAAPGATSAPGAAAGTILDVPAYSQMTHRGHYPQWGNGGEAWCSPTSVAMVLAHYGHAPSPLGVVDDHPDAVVDHTARLVYDHGYKGTGNWAFNTAYAASVVAGDSYVTRLRSLRDAEPFITAGIPLVVSVAWSRGQLTGAPLATSGGHLMVLVGFDAAGNPVVNDPAAPTNAEVRRTYDRAQFEKIWLNASGGATYVIRNS